MTNKEALTYLEPVIASTPLEGYALALRKAYQALVDKVLQEESEKNNFLKNEQD